MRLSLNGKLYAAPIPAFPRNVLDVGTGTGIWAIEFANEHPGSHVIGTDLSPIQSVYTPPNVTFELCDAEDTPWTFNVPFDFIHMRAMLTCFRDPRAVFASAFEALAPGGYIQLRDPIMPFKFHGCPPNPEPECALAEWGHLIVDAAARTGRRWDNARHYERWLREIGFVEVTALPELIPLSPWTRSRRMKYISLWLQHNMLQAMEAISMALFTRVLGWDVERLKEFLERVKVDIKDTRLHAYSEG
jgi:SAM-dependent methyltransferase